MGDDKAPAWRRDADASAREPRYVVVDRAGHGFNSASFRGVGAALTEAARLNYEGSAKYLNPFRPFRVTVDPDA